MPLAGHYELMKCREGYPVPSSAHAGQVLSITEKKVQKLTGAWEVSPRSLL
jgi:hypothetical protein